MAAPTVLVVDDIELNRKLLTAVLRPRGFEVVTASNGLETVQKAVELRPDLILLDDLMPGMNGDEVCRRLRVLDETRLISIVVLNVLAGKEAVARALDMGADDFITKPFNREELLARVRRHLRQRRLGDLGSTWDPGEPEETRKLRSSIAAGELNLLYQPKRTAATGRLVGVEALARWTHPTLGPIPPAWFIPHAERHGLIRALTERVLGIALRQCRAWADAGCTVPVAVNIAALDVQHLGLPALVFELLKRAGVAPSRLTLELTDSTSVADPDRATEVVARLRARGVRIALDGYGSGYSTLRSLYQLPADELKIDPSFTTTLPSDPWAQEIVRSTIILAHDLGLQVVAQGVESEIARRLLVEWGCDVVQGYRVGMPVPAEQLSLD